MADLSAEQARLQEAETVLRRLLTEEHPHLEPLTPATRLVSEAGLSLPELDEIYFAALDTLGRRPPLDDSEVHAPINLNDPNLEELSRHVALNCPLMSPAEQEAVLRPDPTVTTQGDAGLSPVEEGAGLVSPPGDLGMGVGQPETTGHGTSRTLVILAVLVILVAVWLVVRD